MISQLLLATLGINTKTSTPQLDRERPGENRQAGFRVKVWFKHLETVGFLKKRQVWVEQESQTDTDQGKTEDLGYQVIRAGRETGKETRPASVGLRETSMHTFKRGLPDKALGLNRDQNRPQASWQGGKEKQLGGRGWQGIQECCSIDGGQGRSLRSWRFSSKWRSELCRYQGEEHQQHPGSENQKCKGPGAVGAVHRRVDWRSGGQRSTHSSSSNGYCAHYMLGMQVQTGPCGKGTRRDWEDILRRVTDDAPCSPSGTLVTHLLLTTPRGRPYHCSHYRWGSHRKLAPYLGWHHTTSPQHSGDSNPVV